MATDTKTVAGEAAGHHDGLECKMADLATIVNGLREFATTGHVADKLGLAQAVLCLLHGAAAMLLGPHDEGDEDDGGEEADEGSTRKAKAGGRRKMKKAASEEGDAGEVLDYGAAADKLESRLPKQVMEGRGADKTQTIPWAVILPMIPTFVKLIADLFKNR